MSLPTPFRQKLVDKWRELSLLILGSTTLALLQKHGDRLFDSAADTIGKTRLLQITSLLVFASIYLGWKVYKHGKEKPEVVRILEGIEFKRGPRTGFVWIPFCPHCHVVLHPKWDDFLPVRCLAGCGWQSTIKPRELCEILNESNK
jgi:hypothetical protein